MNIESSHIFIRSGDTAYGCIEVFNLEQYQVGVFGSYYTESSKLIIFAWIHTCMYNVKEFRSLGTIISANTNCKWCVYVGSHGAGIIIVNYIVVNSL